MLDTTYAARIDSGSANNASINLTGDPAVNLTFSFDTASADPNLFLDQLGVGGTDAGTLVSVNGGTPTTFTLEFTATLPDTNPGAQQVPDELEGETIALIVVTDPVTGVSTRYMIVLSEIYDPDLAKMNEFGNGAIAVTNEIATPPPQPVCFLSGTVIETPTGPVRVNDLKTGDLVCTADGGPQPLVWVTSSHHIWPGSDDRHKPVLISAGALGKNTPSHDLIVSPQHHIAFRGAVCRELFDEETILAPAKGLTGLRGIRVMAGKTEAEYFHLMLSEHAVLMTHGVGTESFYPGPTAIRMMDKAQRDSLYAILPNLHAGVEVGYGPPAHKKITVRQAELLVRRVGKKPDQGRMPVAVVKSLENA